MRIERERGAKLSIWKECNAAENWCWKPTLSLSGALDGWTKENPACVSLFLLILSPSLASALTGRGWWKGPDPSMTRLEKNLEIPPPSLLFHVALLRPRCCFHYTARIAYAPVYTAQEQGRNERKKEILLKPIELTSLLPSKTRYITRPPPTRWRWEESFAGRFDAVRAALAQPISTSSLRRLVIDRCSGSFFWLFYFILFYFLKYSKSQPVPRPICWTDLDDDVA